MKLRTLRMVEWIFLQFVIIFLNHSTINGLVTEDYCWRDYEGHLPPDAFVVGTNRNNKRLYIGQVLYNDKVIAGKIIEGDDKIYFEYFNVEYSTNQNIKILCSQNPSKFEWIPTQHTEVLELLPSKTLIKGGFEQKCDMYLGRTQSNDDVFVGKVMCCENLDYCWGLYTTNDGKGQQHQTFQILSYDANNNAGNDDLDIDIRSRMNSDIPVSRDSQSCKAISINLHY